jgi:hypothetical protein
LADSERSRAGDHCPPRRKRTTIALARSTSLDGRGGGGAVARPR